jgi:hypothetical protein
LDTQEAIEVVKQKISGAGSRYANATLLRTAVCAIPYIGGSLDVLLSSGAQHVTERRLVALFDAVKTEFASLKEGQVSRDYLQSEEWFDLLLRAMENATRTRDADKIHLYAKLLRSATTSDEPTSIPFEDYLAVLADMSVAEVKVTLAIYEMQKEPPPPGVSELNWAKSQGWEQFVSSPKVVSVEDLPFVLSRLVKAGLIREIVGAYLGYAGGVYAATDVLRRLMGAVFSPSGLPDSSGPSTAEPLERS